MARSQSRPSLDAMSERRAGQITNHEDVLGWFADEALTIAEAAQASAISQSTLRRYVRDLVDAGYLAEGYSLSSNAKTYFQVREVQR